MIIRETIAEQVKKAVQEIYVVELGTVELQATKKEFTGDLTVVVFPILRHVKGNPEKIGKAIGNYLVEYLEEITQYNVVKGFLNLVIADEFYLHFFNGIKDDKNYGYAPPEAGEKAVMVEYSSPNTNKPLHLGHMRNILLGYSVSGILKASGKKVYKTQIINDRGIHICKSMVAYKKYGKGETPESSGLKGDKLVGNYYVKYNEVFKNQLYQIVDEFSGEIQKESNKQENIGKSLYEIVRTVKRSRDYFSALGAAIKEFYKFDHKLKNEDLKPSSTFPFYEDLDYWSRWNNNRFEKLNRSRSKFLGIITTIYGFDDVKKEDLSDGESRKARALLDEKFTPFVPILRKAQEMLRKWEAGDTETVALWKKMNQWVYDGFDITYKNLGVDFDKLYYESDTYLLGKEFVEEGLSKGVFYKKEDGSVWCDLTDEGLDEKIVLRADGTAVYMTQDIGTAIQRVKDHPDVGGMVYTVGNEQDYHFKVLFLILKKLGFQWAKNLYHLSYGMVDLPGGKMKSREGTVVDADDLMTEMTKTAGKIAETLGKLDSYSEVEKQNLYKIIGLGALKYFILKVDPRKRILFDPEASVDFNGNTGPFIQYTYARIQSILRKTDFDYSEPVSGIALHEKEKKLVKQMQLFPEIILEAANNYSPALIANYIYDLVKDFNSFYQNISILGAEDETAKIFRVQLSKKVADIIRSGFQLLGINVPERM